LNTKIRGKVKRKRSIYLFGFCLNRLLKANLY